MFQATPTTALYRAPEIANLCVTGTAVPSLQKSLPSHWVSVDYYPQATFLFKDDNGATEVVQISKSNGLKTLTENLERLKSFGALENNWNGYGAKRLSKRVIRRTKNAINLLRHQPEIFPVATGEIQLEYDKADGSYLEFRIGKKRKVSVFEIKQNGDESETIAKINALDGIVTDFYERSV